MFEVQQLFPGDVTELNTEMMPSPSIIPHGTAAVSGWLMKTTAVMECSPLYRAGMLSAQGSVWLGWSILLTLLAGCFGAAGSREQCSAELLRPRRHALCTHRALQLCLCRKVWLAPAQHSPGCVDGEEAEWRPQNEQSAVVAQFC